MIERRGLILLVIAGLLLVGTIVLVVVGGGPDEPAGEVEPPGPVNAVDGGDVAEPDNGPEISGIEISGTELTIREEGEIVWRAAFGGEIELDENQNVARASDVVWEFEGEGFEDLSLESPLMRADWNEQRLRFSEGIVIEAEGGDLRFSAQTAEYQFDTKKVIGRGDVRFQRGSFYGRAEEVVVDNQRRLLRLKRGSLTRRQ
jgi:hypothetical protein